MRSSIVWTDGPKLLVFGLLRTVTALATRTATAESRYSTAGSEAGQQRHPVRGSLEALNEFASYPPLELRLARRNDVPSIQRCNLATLPENYNSQFYANHLREWPELAFVAVDCSASSPSSDRNSPTFSTFPTIHPEEKVVAYVLGKVEERVVTVPVEQSLRGYYDQPHNPLWSDRQSRFQHDYHPRHDDYRVANGGATTTTTTTERIGHVTSLAVLEPYRRRGLAVELMKQLHYHLAAVHQVDAVGLHVRQSNLAAERLYSGFGYRAAEIIPGYYQDGEDAYFMKKTLPSFKSGLFGGVLRRRVWETGPPDLRLPRTVGIPDFVISPPMEDSSSEQLLTGSM
jgi:ribosomal protein S18 acetylase RimI-like enzyme